MARQNQKNIRKSQEGKVNKNKKSVESTFFDEKSNKTDKKSDKKTTFKKINDDYTITHFEQKVKILNDVSTVDGTLHKNELVTVESRTSRGYKVIDNVGRFWFVDYKDITTKI